MSLDNLKKLLDEVAGNGLSDLHFTTGMVPYIRTREGEMIPVPAFGVVALEEMKEIASFVLPADRRGAWPEMKEMDASFEYNSARFRVNAYYETRGPSLAIRLIGTSIPSPDELGIPKSILSAIDAKHGLVLVTGATGSGKSTSLASLVEYINATRAAHIITIEDPIEYVFNSKKSLVHQREISTHTHSFAKAIRSSLREDPDVVVIGEMRDPETIAAAITLAETGHLVISTLHTNDTVQAIDRIIDAFPPTSQAQIRVQLGMSLVAIMSQALLPKKSWSGRVAAREVLINNDGVRSLIIRGLTHQIYSMIELGANEGMQLMDRSLESLYMSGQISKEVFISRVRDSDMLNIHQAPVWNQ